VDIDRRHIGAEQALCHAALQNALHRLQRRLAQQFGLGDLAQHLPPWKFSCSTRRVNSWFCSWYSKLLRQRMQRLQRRQGVEVELLFRGANIE
jgi:hypothetical protein